MTTKKHIKAVHRMQSFIEKNIFEPIALYQLAQVAGYSPWYAAKIFKVVTKKSPFEYIRLMRLSLASEQLKKQMKIIDVAFDFVFETHEGFTKAFSKQFGMTPQKFQKTIPHLKRFMPPRSKDLKLIQEKGDYFMPKVAKNTNTIFIQVIERPKRKLILKRGIKATHYFEYCDEVGCEVWDQLSEIKQALYEPAGMWLPEKLIKKGTSIYTQGVEVPCDFDEEIPDGFDIIELPACKMMVFQGPPFDDEEFGDSIFELQNTIKDYQPEINGYKWADKIAPRFQLIPLGYRGYIEARPVIQV